MAFQDYLTADGRKMMARAAAGVTITFTKMIVGDGTMDPSKTQGTMEDMVNPIKEIPIASTTVSGNDQVCVKAMFDNKGIETGFYLREKGIYISDGTEEVLGIYANTGDEAEYIDAGTSILIEKSLQTILKMSSDAAASVELSSEDKVSREEFDRYINDFDNPHHVTAEQIGLDKVDNTSDKDKPVSDAVKIELDAIKANFEKIGNEIGTAELETASNTMKAAINEVNSVAKGKNQSIAYDTYSDMITALKAMDKDAINIGQNIYIGVVGVPDLWIYSKEATSNDYLYVSDEAVVSELKTNTTVHIGYYKVAMLETQKVDLTTYQTKTGDAKDNTVGFTSSDVADGSASGWTTVSKLTSGEKFSSIIAKVSQMFKNIRYLYKLIGTADISGLSSEGTVTNGLVNINNNLTNENNENFVFGVKDGVRGFYTDPSRADDSFIPFSSLPKEMVFTTSGVNMKDYFPNTWQKLRTSDFICGVTGFGSSISYNVYDKNFGSGGESVNASLSLKYDNTTGLLTFSCRNGSKQTSHSNDGTWWISQSTNFNGLFCVWKGTYSG